VQMNSGIDALIEELGAEWAPDRRMAIFEVSVEFRDGRPVLVGRTTEPGAIEALLGRIDQETVDEVLRLPDPGIGEVLHAVVRIALAPVQATPHVAAVQISQFVLGHRLDLLMREGPWWRVRGEDGYIGWVHEGYLQTGLAEWAREWERGTGGEPVVSIGAELIDDGWPVTRVPWGGRVIRDSPGRVRLPDGRRAEVGSGELIDVDRLLDRFPPRGESIARSARRWLGSPYLWGGVTPAGVDCSGFIQSVFWIHGIALPRDSDQQARVGAGRPAGDRFEDLRAGDLLFFAERPGRVTHVAISLGGPIIVHSALSNGGVQINDLTGDLPTERLLRDCFVEARRVLPD